MNGYGIIAPNTFGKITGAPEPICEPMDAIAEAVAWATCTSDPHQVHAGLPAGLILGHEVVARLVKVGSMVKDFKVGDIVCVGAVTPDWTWPNCQDNIHQDANGAAQGMNWCVTENGTFAERFRIRQVDCNATYIPKSLTYEHALMASDMVTTGFHGVEMAHVTWGDTVVVMGIGPVGLMSVAGSALRGAGRIIAIGRRPITLELAKEYGATDVLNYTDGPIDEQVLELTGGVAPDCCITTGGTNDTFARCLKMVKPERHRLQPAGTDVRHRDPRHVHALLAVSQAGQRRPVPRRPQAHAAPAVDHGSRPTRPDQAHHAPLPRHGAYHGRL